MNWFLSFFQEDREFGVQRSPLWPSIRKQHLRIESFCAACGTDKDLAVHHVIPVHIDESLEESDKNLITLCKVDHLLVGHLNSFFSFNTSVRKDAAALYTKILNRP